MLLIRYNFNVNNFGNYSILFHSVIDEAFVFSGFGQQAGHSSK